MRRMLLILFATVSLSILFSGCAGPKAAGGGGSTGPGDKCGDCLNREGGQVCTPVGTMENSCFAICREKLILCRQACPCPPGKGS